jgi:hypothetical protein
VTLATPRSLLATANNRARCFAGSYRRRQWLAPLAFAIHNLEEAIWLPRWSRRAGRWHPVVGDGPFRFAVIVLSSEAVAITAWSARGGPRSRGAALSGGLSVMLIANAIVPHLAATIAQRRYTPGTATALAINVPVATSLLREALAERYVAPASLARGAAVTIGVAVTEIPVLFRLGERLLEAARQ